MSQTVGYAPVKKNPRIRVRYNAPPGIALNSITYDNPTIMYPPGSNDGSFIASWPISEPTEVCWDVPANWRLIGTITKTSGGQAAITYQTKFTCGKIHVYQEGDGLRLLLLTDIREVEAPTVRPQAKAKGPAGKKPAAVSVSSSASPELTASPKAKTTEAIAVQKDEQDEEDPDLSE